MKVSQWRRESVMTEREAVQEKLYAWIGWTLLWFFVSLALFVFLLSGIVSDTTGQKIAYVVCGTVLLWFISGMRAASLSREDDHLRRSLWGPR
jgi:hypothetical protein